MKLTQPGNDSINKNIFFYIPTPTPPPPINTHPYDPSLNDPGETVTLRSVSLTSDTWKQIQTIDFPIFNIPQQAEQRKKERAYIERNRGTLLLLLAPRWADVCDARPTPDRHWASALCQHGINWYIYIHSWRKQFFLEGSDGCSVCR